MTATTLFAQGVCAISLPKKYLVEEIDEMICATDLDEKLTEEEISEMILESDADDDGQNDGDDYGEVIIVST